MKNRFCIVIFFSIMFLGAGTSVAQRSSIVTHLGMNSLTGFGIEGSYKMNSQTVLDIATGIGAYVFKTGLGIRYFLPKKWHYFYMGGAFVYSSSSDWWAQNVVILLHKVDGRYVVPIRSGENIGDSTEPFVAFNPSVSANLKVGVEFVPTKHFLISTAVGYSYSPFTKVKLMAGILNEHDKKIFSRLDDIGLLQEIRIGYAF